MVSFIIISQLGQVDTQSVKELKKEELYKKCKFRKKDHFMKMQTWKISYLKNNIYIHLYARNCGKATTINKYELPPPLDTTLFYGAMAIIASKDIDGDNISNLTKEMWEKIYNKLMGGFEDLEEEEMSEDEFIPKEFKTIQGYSKEDNFVADDDDIEYMEDTTPSEEDEYDFEEDDDTTDDEKKYYSVEENDDKSQDHKSTVSSHDSDDSDEGNNADDEDDDDSELSEETYVTEN